MGRYKIYYLISLELLNLSWLIYSNKSKFVESSAAMKELTKKICWELVSINKDTINAVGAAIYRKPTTNECYEQRSQNEPPICDKSDDPNAAWYSLYFCYFILFLPSTN